MPSKSFSQARMMAGAAHDPVFAKKVGVPTKVAEDYNMADKKSGFLKSAMRAKGPASGDGKMRMYAEGGQVSEQDEKEYRRSGQELIDRIRQESTSKAKDEKPRKSPPPPRSDRKNPDRATVTPKIHEKPPQFAKGGAVRGAGAAKRGMKPARFY
jgi:hypothetical protein